MLTRAAIAAVALGCGGTQAAQPAPPPVAAAPDAAPDPIGPRASREECEQAFGHLAELAGEPRDAAPDEAQARFVDDCVTQASQRDVACVLAAPDLEALDRCGGTREP